jgi:hypothetical protein
MYFPLCLDEGMFYCGFNAPKSFGGNRYFVQHAEATGGSMPQNSCLSRTAVRGHGWAEFTWVLPGHRQHIYLPQEHMSQEIQTRVHRMPWMPPHSFLPAFVPTLALPRVRGRAPV